MKRFDTPEADSTRVLIKPHFPASVESVRLISLAYVESISGRGYEMLLTKTFGAETYARALESWSWLGLDGKVAVLASLFGDVFLQDREGYWFLDSLEGTISQVAASRDELQAKLGSVEGQDNYLLGALAMAANRGGMRLKPNEVYDFQIPPVLGGKTDLSNVTVMDFVVSLNVAGQLHEQVRRLPPGT